MGLIRKPASGRSDGKGHTRPHELSALLLLLAIAQTSLVSPKQTSALRQPSVGKRPSPL